MCFEHSNIQAAAYDKASFFCHRILLAASSPQVPVMLESSRILQPSAVLALSSQCGP